MTDCLYDPGIEQRKKSMVKTESKPEIPDRRKVVVCQFKPMVET